MGAAIGQSLPIALGVLMSPMPIVALVLVLVSRRARSNGPAFALGWSVGIVAVGGLTIVLADTGDAGSATEAADWVGVLKIVLGVLLIMLAARSWRKRPRGAGPATTPPWMAALDGFGVVRSFGLAFGLGAVNPKNLLLVISGGTAIASATGATGERVIALIVFVIVASAGIMAPLVIYLSMGARAEPMLRRLKTWLTENNAVIMTVVLLVLGTKILGDGIAIL